MIDLIIRPMADAFMQVGVFVALVAAPFAWARYRWGGRLDGVLDRHRRWGPLVAVVLTTPPGCGGAIVIIAGYARGAVSYGAAVAALVATMGDACWVLLAAEPVLTIQLKMLLILSGVVTGYVVDLLAIDPLRKSPARVQGHASWGNMRADGAAEAPAPAARRVAPTSPRPWTDTTDPLADGPLARLRHEPGVVGGLLWLFLGFGLLVSLPVTFKLADPAAMGERLLGNVDPYLALGALGSVMCLAVFVRERRFMADDDADQARPTSGAQMLRHTGREVAFVTIWVTVAYIAWELFSAVTGFDGSTLPVLGVLGVLVGTLVGFIPGCAIQIVFAGIFLSGGMPISTLAANMISQDGDALIPLLAMHRRSALLATAITTVPAITVGLGLLLLS